MFSLRTRQSLLARHSGIRAVRPLPATRHFQTSPSSRLPSKEDIQNKDRINTDSTEYSKSGGDDTTANKDVAFSADKTRPEEQMAAAGKEAESKGTSNPLNTSPAHHEISHTRHPQEGGAQGSKSESGQQGERSGASGKGSAPKGAKV